MKAASTIRAGDLRERIVIQSKSIARNSIGEEVVTWPDFLTLWAQAEPLRGREFFAAAQMQSSVEVRFRIRYRSDITVDTHRVLWRAVTYDIRSIIDADARRVVLELMCASGVHDAR
jgi:SPP1 family predicted phage head-tail adaptor